MTETAPDSVVADARAYYGKPHPVRSVLLGVLAGFTLVQLLLRTGWPAALGLVLLMVAWGAWDCSYAAARRRSVRDFRRRMNAAGWCWHCHGRHLGKHCPQRRA